MLIARWTKLYYIFFFGNFRNFTVKLETTAECIEFPKLEAARALTPHT